ncbi:MAG: DUF6263 family protein [Bacteroidota bacterium]|nr:DUF6263 family protein [Bacteroidota bacterium]
MKKITLFVATSIFISTGLFAQNDNLLNLKTGQKYMVENKIVTNSTAEIQGQSMESTANITSTYSIEVKGMDNKNYNLSNTVTGLKMNMNQMGQDITFDSQKKEDMDGAMGMALKDFINKPTDVALDKSGTVIPSKDRPKIDDANAMAKQLANFESTGYGSDLAFVALPKNLKVGTIWTSKTDSAGNGTIRVTNFTVKEIKGNMAILALTGTSASNMKMQNQGMEINTKLNGTFTGEETVDTNTGVIQSNSTVGDSKGTVSAMGQEFPLTSKITSNTTVK